MGVPEHMVGVTVATDAVLARGDDVVVSLGRVLAFPAGFVVELRAVGRVDGNVGRGPQPLRAAAPGAVAVLEPPPAPEPPPPPPPRPRAAPAGPPWWAPGDLMRVLPGVAALEAVLGRRAGALVTASHALVYPNGWQLEVRWTGPGDPPWPSSSRPAWRPGYPGDMPDDYLRFGLELADGRRADNLTQLPLPDARRASSCCPRAAGASPRAARRPTGSPRCRRPGR